MKIFILSLSMLLAFQLAMAQPSLERQVIGSSGNFSTANNVSLSSTVGETVVKTAISGSIVLTQGFQQPDGGPSVGIEDELSIVLDYTISPNPTTEWIHVLLSTDKPITIEMEIFDNRGRQVPVPGQKMLVNGTAETDFDLSALADGIYTLTFRDEAGRIFKSFKVQRIH